ncbi:DUF1800 domain-containing protein [Mucisphaera sp.]|uniref:DUF1800 domain-containing protein n=1 Tax=Mucisphaera sp. TaxID=2913024 RepID=UPI003D0E85D1
MDTSLAPLDAQLFGPPQARHLLARAGLGPDRQRARELVSLGPVTAAQALLDSPDTSSLPDAPVDPDVRRPFTEEERQAYRRAIASDDPAIQRQAREARQSLDRMDRQMVPKLQDWWIERMLATPDPTREHMTLFWHGHFATAHQPVRDTFLMYRQNDFFRRNALGSFATLARYIVRDPAMIKYLNNHQNRKGEPNENLARELMELFTLGEGAYREQDIKEGARALTGFTYQDNDFNLNQRQHDDGNKTILGRKGRFDGDDFVNILLAQQACARYIALKLYRHLVADVSDRFDDLTPPIKSVVDQLARRLRRDNYDLKPTLQTLLASRHFHDPAIVGQKIKSPIQLVTGTARALQTPNRSTTQLRNGFRAMGQSVFDPPSVAGWPVGRAWINTSTLFARQNTCVYLLTGKVPGRNWNRRNTNYEPMKLIAGMDPADTRTIANTLIDDLLGHHLSDERRKPLVDFLTAENKPANNDRLIGFLTLVTAMPEYQLC